LTSTRGEYVPCFLPYILRYITTSPQDKTTQKPPGYEKCTGQNFRGFHD